MKNSFMYLLREKLQRVYCLSIVVQKMFHYIQVIFSHFA